MTTRYKLSQYLVTTDPVFDHRTDRRKRVVFATRSGAVRVIDDRFWSLLNESGAEQVPGDTLADLLVAEILVPADEDELGTILSANEEEQKKESSLRLVVQPSAWCQLDCGYCGQEHTRQRLDAENQDRLIERTRKQLEAGSYDVLDVCWFGGEPLTGLRAMRSLSRRFRALAEDVGCRYSAKVATNGLSLTPKLATELVEEMNVCNIEVTLDGPPEYHDRRRPLRSGAGSFDTIFKNVVALARREDLDVELIVRCNVDQHNREGVLPLIRMLVDADVHRRIKQFAVTPVYNCGNHAGDENVEHGHIARWEMEWLVEMAKLGFPVGLIPRRTAINCMAMLPGASLVDPHGTLFNCKEVTLIPEYEEPPSTSLPVLPPVPSCTPPPTRNRYAIGDLSLGITAEKLPFREFNDRIRRGHYACHACPMLPVCGGQCPKKWADGELPCPPMKFNIRERLLLAYALGRIENEKSA